MEPLPAEPMSTVETLSRLAALSREMSRQALDLYDDLARRMAELGNEPAQDAFGRIRATLRDAEAPEPAEDVGQAPAVFHDEDLGASRLVTPYAAYSLAVRNQERAFAFWTHVSANSPDPEVRSEAERLARAEIVRVKSLRTARRQAFHAGRRPALPPEALRTLSVEELRRSAGETENAIAELHGRIAALLADAGDPRAPTMAAIAVDERDRAERLGAGAAPDQRDDLPRDAESLVALATERLEAAVEFYLAAAEASQREEVVSLAQDLADRGIQRLSRLR